MLISIILLVVILWFVLKIPAVQNWVGQKVVNRLSTELDTKVTIKKVSFSLFNNMNIEGLYIEDLQKDTLLYAGVAQVKITDWFFFKDKIALSYIGLNDFVINTYRKDSAWNYQFIINKFASTDTSTKPKKKSNLELAFEYVLLENGDIRQKDVWLGHNQNISFNRFEITTEALNLSKKIIHLNELTINSPNYTNYIYNRLKPPSLATNSIDSSVATKHWQLFGWDVTINKLAITNGTVNNTKATAREAYNYFDGAHLSFTNINANFEKIKWNTDTITLYTKLSTKERCGLDVKELNANIKAYANTIEFNDLLLQTPNSIIKDKLWFSFNDFNEDISDFINKVTIKSNLVDSKIAVNDLALFAPNIKNNIKNDVLVTAKVNGTVSNLNLKDAFVKTGNSMLQGSLTMNGLPNINETYINFSNGTVSTNYTDLVGFAPSLQRVKGISLSKLGQVNFKGSYTGFINDFVTYGTLQTNLGTVVTDLNMKLLPNTLPTYSGKIFTESFALGRLLNNTQLGSIGFNGKVDGKGFTLTDIDANVNGTTTKLTYGNYTYQNITTIGKLRQKGFNGDVLVNDPNLVAKLKGQFDFSTSKPKFNLEADIEKSNFKKLQFIKDDYTLTGKVKLNFEGSTVNDFDGTITLDDATLTKDGEALPFSFLTLQSNKTADGRYLQFNSNEFDGYVNGQFTYNNIVNAFSLFLHQYYPQVFAKPKQFDTKQSFDFSLTTKNVDAYTKLINPDLVGFNNAIINGQINTFTNEAAFKASIPFFAFRDYSFGNLELNGIGSTDSLVIRSSIEKLTINDSIAFTNAQLNFQTINTKTSFNIKSTSNQTLNELDVNGNVLVFDNGVQINFDPSSFTVNNKKWRLEKNGELILRKDLVFVKDLKFVHNDQEIVISNDLNGSPTDLVADIKNLEINDFVPLFLKSPQFYGKLTGKIYVSDPLGKPVITTESSIAGLVKDKDSIGKVNISGKFDVTTNNADYSAASFNPKYLFEIKGHYYPKDSIRPPIYNSLKLKGTDISIIDEYLNTVFSNITGNAYGDVEVYGTNKQQTITGLVNVDSLSMLVNFTNVRYHSINPTIEFKPAEIEFSGIDLYDDKKQLANIKIGKILHDGFFKRMRLDIEMSTNKMLLLNTNRDLNATFFGTATADAKMVLKGEVDKTLTMKLDVKNPAEAVINLNTSASSKTLGKADFVEFKAYGREMQAVKQKINSSFVLDMNLTANTNAKVNVILDELAGDNISAIGKGDLNIKIENGDIKMYGGYEVESGKYTFSLQSWFKKDFTVQKGSTINWNGSAYDALLNIDAAYNAKNVNLQDLNTGVTRFQTSTADLLVQANLTEKLSKPKIKFGIKYADTKTKDPEVENLLALIAQDESKLNKQVAFLILFDRLLPETTSSAGLLQNTAINTISGLLTSAANNAINDLLAQTFGNNTLRANIDFRTYNPGALNANQTGSVERASTTFGFSKSLFENRLVFYINGNLDFGLLSYNQNSFALLPNLLVEYKIVPNGSIVATFFHRQTIDALATDQTRNRRANSGLGVAWRKESDAFADLFRFKKKKKI